MASKPIYFPDAAAFRQWLEKNHSREPALLVGFYRRSTGKPSMTWSESVDQALCFGWIDGVRRTVDEERYTIRFTPRRPDSNWSRINVEKMASLKKSGLLHKAGEAAFARRREDKTGIYSFEQAPRTLAAPYLRRVKANKSAWTFFQAQAPYYRKLMAFWIMSAKKEETREKRLTRLIHDSARQRRVGTVG